MPCQASAIIARTNPLQSTCNTVARTTCRWWRAACSRALGAAGPIAVNSLHGQGVDRLAPGLVVEATAEDGLVEAFSVAGAQAFALGVQWHPEWKVLDNPVSMKIFEAFGDACRSRARIGRRAREPVT